MGRVPVDASHGVQVAFTDINNELASVRNRLAELGNSGLLKEIDIIQKNIKNLQLRRIIPPPGQRAHTGSGPLYLDDALNWSSPTWSTGTITVTTTDFPGGFTIPDDGVPQIMLVDASAGDFDIFLPAASIGKLMLEVKKIDSSANLVRINPAGSDLIEGDVTLELVFEGEAVPFVSNGIDYWNVL